MTDEIRYDIGLNELNEIGSKEVLQKQAKKQEQEISQKQTKTAPAKNEHKDEFGLHLVWDEIKSLAGKAKQFTFPQKSWQVWYEHNGLQYYAQANSRELAERIAEHAESLFLDESFVEKLPVSDQGPVYESYEEYMVKQGVETGINMCLFLKT